MSIKLLVTTEFTKIQSVPIRLAQVLDDRLRYLAKEANEYSFMYSTGRWDGYNRLYDRARGQFPTGLLQRVKRILKEEGYDCEIETALPPMPDIATARQYKPRFDLRPYQTDAVNASLSRRRGVIHIPTGGGKTETAQAVIATSQVSRCLFLVPSRALLHQTARRMQAVFPDSNIIIWGDGKQPPLTPPDEYIVVATVQSAFRDLSHAILRHAGLVFVDESHHQSAETFNKVTRACRSARYLIGLTATPFRSDNADLELEAWMGPIISTVSYDHLIENNWLVAPEFKVVYTLEEALSHTQDKRTLIFSEKAADLERMAHVFDAHDVTVLTSKSKRIQDRLQDFSEGRIQRIAATPIFDEGLDVPDMDAVVMFSTCGSRTKVIQRVGRVMRISPGKEKCYIYDLLDHKYGDRLDAYRKEPAFARRLMGA